MNRVPEIQGIRMHTATRSEGSVIPDGEIAHITHWNGTVTIKHGPGRKPLFSRVWFFDKIIVPEGEQGYIIDELGNYSETCGPRVVHVHPEGAYKPHQRHELAHYEAMVVINEDGIVHAHTGKTTPVVWVKDRERVHTFHWTGSRGDTEFKTPGALNINVLRLQDTQTYFAFPVRTHDNIVVLLRLMIYYGYDSIEKLLENNDPLGAMYNKIMATLVEYVATMPFEEFKEGTNEKISRNRIFHKEKAFFSALGIEIHDVILRAWEPTDAQVQRVLEKAATIQTEKSLDQAEHERKMAKFGFEGQELEKAQLLDQKRALASAAEGDREAQKMLTVYNALSPVVGEETARRILVLRQASEADALYITPSLLNG